MAEDKKRLNLVIPDGEITRIEGLPKLKDIKLNLDGRKPRKSKRRNLYKLQLGRLRRFYW